MRRILSGVNVLLAVVIPLTIGLFYWLIIRPAPQTSGTIAAAVAASVRIIRDDRGMPHITAASIDDALFAQGFVTAQDRMWQMDMLRRYDAGELAEILGPAALELDINSRKLGLRAAADRFLHTMPAEDRATLAAYARGVNAYLQQNRNNLPPEFRAISYEPRPWRPADSVLTGLHMYRVMTLRWERERDNGRMFSEGDPAKLKLLFPVRSGEEIAPGSNAWVMSGVWTASGKPILANDPHLEWNMPAVWHQVHLQAPGLNVTGASVPGMPGVGIGHNDRIAWGITSLEADEMDLFEEKIDLRTGVYVFDGQPRQARREVEIIAVKGQRPVEIVTWVTQHGPVFTSDGPRQYSLAWTALQPGAFSLPLVSLNRAANWEQFRQVLSRFPGPGFNFLYADIDGNIGYQAVGRLPIRKDNTGERPVDGTKPANDWQGVIPFDDLPRAYNPPSGLIVSANQNPFPEKYPYVVAGHFTAPYRQRQIDARLRTRKGWKPSDMLGIQTDVYSALHDFLAREAVRMGASKPAVAGAVELFKGWNAQMNADAAAPFLATLYYQHLRRTIAEKASPKYGAEWTTEIAPAVVEHLLRTRPPGWFDDWDKMMLDTLADAYDEAARMQGRTASKWNYGLFNELTISHPVARNIPWVGQYFSLGPVRMSGSSTTVKQTTRRLGPSMRFVADLSAWDASLMNITSGETAHLLSGHYKDQWQAYLNGTSFPLPFVHIKGSTLTLSPH